MFWSDKIAQELKDKASQLVDDMKTPSGAIHVGALRGVIIHDLVFKSLKHLGVAARFTYIFDSMDPMDGLPIYLNSVKYKPEMGKPLFKIPAPDGKEQSFAHQYALDFQKTFNSLGVHPEVLWSHELYQAGKLNDQIKLALDNSEKIQDIYQEISGSSKKGQGWLPFQPICENCGKMGTTLSSAWDGKKVTYECKTDLVEWAEGCGHQGKISPYNGTGKLPWKVEWPAKWTALGITIEGEGKDHSSKGGSRDIANHISTEIFKSTPPYDIPYEWFLFGGRKMSTSKGTGATASEVASILPPELLRFLMTRVKPNQAFDFDPTGDTIPSLFDEYDRAQRDYYSHERTDLGRIYELSQLDKTSSDQPFVVRFSLLAQWVQMPNIDELKEAEKLKDSTLSEEEKVLLNQRISTVKLWLDKYAPAEDKFSVQEGLPDISGLSSNQKQLLGKVVGILDQNPTPEEFQNQIYSIGKELDLSSIETFQAIYTSLLGRSSGPKASWLILSLDKEFVKKRFQEVSMA